jgi:hypothetical protein
MDSESQGHMYFFNANNFVRIRQYIQYYTQYYFLINTVIFSIEVVICNICTEQHYTDALFNCLAITYNAVS